MINIQSGLILNAGIEMSSLTPLSGIHLRCACLCVNRCKEIEQEFRDKKTVRGKDNLHQEDMAYACGAIITSIAFLEATVNEVFQDFFDQFDKLNVNESELTELKLKWDNDKLNNKKSILYSNLENKYSDIVYKKILHKEIDKKSECWTNFKDLIKLRNLLVHFKAEWQKELPKKDNQYKIVHLGKLCKQNPFMKDTGNPVFPKKLLCSDCAIWSINVSTKFINTFSKDLSDSNIGLSLRIDTNKILQEYSFETS